MVKAGTIRSPGGATMAKKKAGAEPTGPLGPLIAANLYRLGYGDIVIRSAEVARLVTEKTGQAMTRQRVGAILNAVNVSPDTVATLAKAVEVKPAELTREPGGE